MGRYRKETYILQFTSKLNAEKMYTEYMLWRLDVICKKGTTFSLVKYDAKFPSSPIFYMKMGFLFLMYMILALIGMIYGL